MKIAIDGSRGFFEQRTGIEEYSFQVISHLRGKLGENNQVVLYLKKGQGEFLKKSGFELPNNWTVKEIGLSRFWTQIGLSWEMFRSKADTLFVPAHTVPIIHPKNTIVVIHGLEYEFVPGAYSWWDGFYMRWSIRKSCKWSNKVISVSENTKKDLMRLYGVSGEKISVIYEGYSAENQKSIKSNVGIIPNTNYKMQDTKYFLFIGRVEKRKNIIGIIEAFEILKEKYQIPHKLILAGRGGFGFEEIRQRAYKSKYETDIILTGFVNEEEKWSLLENADLCLFSTYYEGFGIPVLEAQSMGVPVIASNNSSIPEVVGDSLKEYLVDPFKSGDIAEKMEKIIHSKEIYESVSKAGIENVKRFSWEKCAEEIALAISN